MQEIKITANEAGQRFDKMLAKYLNEAPKSFIYKMLRKKNIVLNGKKATGNEMLQAGDQVKFFLSDETISKFSKLQFQKTEANLNIIYEDTHVLMINKPAGMLSQKAEAKDVSLVEHLISYMLTTGQLTEADLRTSNLLSAIAWIEIPVDLLWPERAFWAYSEWENCFKNVQ